MRLDRTRPLLCFVDDRRGAEFPVTLRELDEEAWSAVDLVQVRGKCLSPADLEGAARDWVERLEGVPTAVIVNDRVDVALAVGADGAHLGGDDMPLEAARESVPEGFLLGRSAHTRDELLLAQAAGADYAGLGAFYPSSTKPEAVPLDPSRAGLLAPFPALTIPVLAIGGLTVSRVADVLRVPVITGVAVSGAIRDAADPRRAVRELREALDAVRDGERPSIGR